MRTSVGSIRKVRFADRLRALELLAKRHGMLIDKSEVKVEGLTNEQAAERAFELLQSAMARKKAAEGQR